MADTFRIAVLASGRGSNFEALRRACDEGGLPARIVGLFSDKPDCGAVRIAQANGIDTWSARPRAYATREDFDVALFDAVERVHPDLIVCAGYMRLISAEQVSRVLGRMINIHPSLLPRYPGLDTHARALAAGDAEHGASVHYVIPALDAGPVLAQVRVPVLSGDTAESLAHRVIAREHALLRAAVDAIARGRVRMREEGLECDGCALDMPWILDADDALTPSLPASAVDTRQGVA